MTKKPYHYAIKEIKQRNRPYKLKKYVKVFDKVDETGGEVLT